MRFVLTQPITIPPGTEFRVSDELGTGGIEALVDYGQMRVFLGRAEALREGIVVARPELRAVER